MFGLFCPSFGEFVEFDEFVVQLTTICRPCYSELSQSLFLSVFTCFRSVGRSVGRSLSSLIILGHRELVQESGVYLLLLPSPNPNVPAPILLPKRTDPDPEKPDFSSGL